MRKSGWLAVWCCGTLVLGALGEPSPPDNGTARIEVLVSEVSEAREGLKNSDLSDALKASVGELLDQAAARLEAAAEWYKQAKELAELVPAGPARVEALEKELAALADDGAEDRKPTGNFEELRESVERMRAEIERLEGELLAAERSLVELRERPVEIGVRLPVAQAELAQKEAAAAVPAEEGDVLAERLLQRAELEALRAEVALLTIERGAQPLREKLSALRIQVLEMRLATERERLAATERRLGEQVRDEMADLRRELAEVSASLPSEQTGLRELADEMADWIPELEALARGGERVARRSDRTREKLETLRRDNERLRRQIELGGFEGAFTQLLLEQRQRLPNRRGLDFDLRQLDREITEAQLEGLRIDGLKRELAKSRERWSGDEAAGRLLEMRGGLLDRLDTAQRALIRDLARLGADQKAYRDLAVEFSEFLSDQLFWRRSSPPVGAKFFRGLRPSVASWFAPDGWRDLFVALRGILERRPIAAGVAGLVLAGLLALRGRLKAVIADRGRRIRRISTDHLGHTLLALLATLLLALPVPLVLGLVSVGLASEADSGPWVRGLARWMGWAAWMLAWILSLRAMAAKSGIGRDHFGWKPEACEALRRSLKRLALIYLPAVLIASVTFFDPTPHAFDSLGRLAFILGQVGLAWTLAGLFDPSSGVFAEIIRERPERLLSRGRRLWFGLLVGIPGLLVVLSGIGYSLTAFVLAERFLISLRWVGAGVIIYGVFLRWLMIKQRRIALREAIEQRRARREAAAREETADEDSGETVTIDDDQVVLELEDVVRQTRRMARSLVGIGVIVAISHGLEAGLPLEQAGDNLSFLSDLEWLGMVRALLILLVTVTVVKNLPGLLDLVGLRGSGMSPGSRYAISTLSQYGLAAVGIFMVTGALDLDWSRFGWIAAALSVGLGFGLQEVVANFVCGIILLFERPIRVGDVVTVGDVTGTVSRIRMRATTITNWERQEFVVPNKEFITGSLINWTLSSTLNRITVPVGVAYGSDTVVARRILAEIAEVHPQVLADPAPMVTFESFADSTLNLVLRCYLATLDNRLRTITELHEEIDRRFKEAGIEIAFPQRDLHLRSMPEGWSRPDAARNP